MRAEESTRRVAAVRSRLTDLELDALMVTAPENTRYLSGFSGTLGYLVITGEGAEILGDSRYWLQMEAEPPLSRWCDRWRRAVSSRCWRSVSRGLHCAGLASNPSI